MSPRPALVLQHGPQGPPANLADWLDARGIEFVLHRAWDDPPPSDPRDFAFIACLGAAQSVNDPAPEWIGQEVALLRAATQNDVPVLGLCWGGQALAAALGGRVTRAREPECGWLAVASQDPAIPTGPWLHYHYDTFSIPPGAREVARTPVGPSAFRLGRHLGLQFHPEAPPVIGEIWAHSDPNLSHDEVRELARAGARFGAAARRQAFALFDAWCPLP